MKKWIIMALGLTIGASVSSLYSMELPEEKQLIITNESGDSITIRYGIDDIEPLESILQEGGQLIIPFYHSIDSFTVAGPGVLSWGRCYMGELQPIIEENPDTSILVSIRPPDSSGWFGLIKKQVNPYELDVEASAREAGIIALIPQSKKILDAFSNIAPILKEDPDTPIILTDVLGISPGATADMAQRVIDFKKAQWQRFMERARMEEEAAYSKKIIAVLDKVQAILTMDPERLGTAALMKLGFVPKDPEQRQLLATVTGTYLQRLVKNKMQEDLRNLLLDKPIEKRVRQRRPMKRK